MRGHGTVTAQLGLKIACQRRGPGWVPAPGRPHPPRSDLRPCATTAEPTSCGSCRLRASEPKPHSKKSHCREKPSNRNSRAALARHSQRGLADPVQQERGPDMLCPWGLLGLEEGEDVSGQDGTNIFSPGFQGSSGGAFLQAGAQEMNKACDPHQGARKAGWPQPLARIGSQTSVRTQLGAFDSSA